MPQQRIDEVLVTPKKKVRPEEVLIAATVAEVSPVKIDEEIAREEAAAELGQEFVKNGCRDRYGKLRSNQGGRPKKKKVPGADLPAKSNRKAPGNPGKVEWGAIEKLQMITTIEQIMKKVSEDHACRSEKYLEVLQMRAVKKHFPHFQKTYKIKEFLANKGLWQQIAVENKLGKNIASPWQVKRGAQNSSLHKHHGHAKGAGFRKPGGGRKNKFLKIWQRVKVSHTIDRLRGVEVDEQDIFLKF